MEDVRVALRSDALLAVGFQAPAVEELWEEGVNVEPQRLEYVPLNIVLQVHLLFASVSRRNNLPLCTDKLVALPQPAAVKVVAHEELEAAKVV